MSENSSYPTKIKRDRMDVLEQILLKQYKTKKEIDEAWLRYFVYGDIKEKETCDIYQKVKEKTTYKDRFPTVFAYALINHLVDCNICLNLYMQDDSSPTTKGEES